MSEVAAREPSLNVEPDLWVDLEVPYHKIDEKWDERYEAKLRTLVGEGRIQPRTLHLYLRLEDNWEDPDDAEAALEEILSIKGGKLARNLLCQYKFGYGVGNHIIKDCARKIDAECAETDFQDLYYDAYDAGDKTTLIALIQLIDSQVLKDVLVLEYCYGKSPRLVSISSDFEGLTGDDTIENIVEKMSEGDFRTYRYWHSFTHDSKRYVIIKRQIDDDVERQAEENLEEEPAEFVVLKFIGENLEIYSSTNTIAGKTRTGVNEAVDTAEFEEPDAANSRQSFEQVVDDVEGLDDLDLSELDIDDVDLQEATIAFAGLKLESSPLPDAPSITIKNSEGVSSAISALRESGYDLTESLDDIQKIYIQYNDREYRVRPVEKTVEGEIQWIFRYNASYLTDNEKSEFESLIREVFGVLPVFEAE